MSAPACGVGISGGGCTLTLTLLPQVETNPQGAYEVMAVRLGALHRARQTWATVSGMRRALVPGAPTAPRRPAFMGGREARHSVGVVHAGRRAAAVGALSRTMDGRGGGAKDAGGARPSLPWEQRWDPGPILETYCRGARAAGSGRAAGEEAEHVWVVELSVPRSQLAGMGERVRKRLAGAAADTLSHCKDGGVGGGGAVGGEVLEVSTCAVLFTLGINERQTVANRTGRAGVQSEVNEMGLRRTEAYARAVEAWRQDACARGLPVADAVAGSGCYLSGRNEVRAGRHCCGRGARLPTRAHAHAQISELLSQLRGSVARSDTSKYKITTLVQTAELLVRGMCGARVTMCKSAKDRTSMSVTLEEVVLARARHAAVSRDGAEAVLLEALRAEGVRLENARKNVGKRKFAFNRVQLELFPREYRPPLYAIGKAQT